MGRILKQMDKGGSVLITEERFCRDFKTQQILFGTHKAEIKSNFNKNSGYIFKRLK